MPISHSAFIRRRKTLMSRMAPNSIAIMPAAREVMRNGDTPYPFRQHSNFYYLTGFGEPDAVLILLPSGQKKPGQNTVRTILFCRNKDPNIELWEGYRPGPEGACEDYGADEAFPLSDMDNVMPELLAGTGRVYYTLGCCETMDRQVMQWVNTVRSQVRSGAHSPDAFFDLNSLVHAMRLYKSATEIALMRRAATLSAKAHCGAMKLCKPGMSEYHLEAEILHEWGRNGARSPAYPSIVGAGQNACILHYTANNTPIKDGDLVLIDAGCEYEHYAADITRTFPANGRFSTEQKALYEVVLAAQLAAIKKIKPGNRWHRVHDATVKVITKGLVSLGLLKGDVNKLIKEGAYRAFYMHRAGHWLGMDVHDVGDYKVDGKWRVLEKGMVMTVEPGIYVAADNHKVAKKWRGIGIRIEDDVVVTRDGCEVLSAGVPKTVAEIEAMVGSRHKKRHLAS